MPLCTKIDIDSGDIVLDGDPDSPKRGSAPNFQVKTVFNCFCSNQVKSSFSYNTKSTLVDYKSFFVQRKSDFNK